MTDDEFWQVAYLIALAQGFPRPAEIADRAVKDKNTHDVASCK